MFTNPMNTLRPKRSLTDYSILGLLLIIACIGYLVETIVASGAAIKIVISKMTLHPNENKSVKHSRANNNSIHRGASKPSWHRNNLGC